LKLIFAVNYAYFIVHKQVPSEQASWSPLAELRGLELACRRRREVK